MKKIITFILIICILLSGYSVIKNHKSKAKNSQNKDITKLLVEKSVTDEKELESQFAVVKETDTDTDTKINKKKSIDYISNLKDNSESVTETDQNNNNQNNNRNNIENDTSVNQTDPYINVNENSLNILSRLIESESGDEPYMGKLAVASVVINRMKEDKETIDKVIFQKGQFDGVKTQNFNINPSDDSKKAALEVLQGHNVVPTSYFFADLRLCSPDWATTDRFIVRIGNHWFFKK